MILVSLEGQQPQLLEAALRSVQEPRVVHDLLQEQRIGVVQNGQIHWAPGRQPLEIRGDVGEGPHRFGGPLEQDTDVAVALIVGSPRH